MKVAALFFILITIGFSSLAQPDTIRGKVLDKNTGNSLIYVSIGVVGKPIGTVTNNNGEFELLLRAINSNDTIRFSLIGYKPIKIALKDISVTKEHILSLEKDTIRIPEVVITRKAFTRERRVGRKSQSSRLVTGWSGYGKGGERCKNEYST